MNTAERIAVGAHVTGRVQGVWFRGWTVKQAAALGLDGWVRNNPDGSVELLAAGAPDAVEALLRACLSGPPLANVTGVERCAAPAEDAPPPGAGFSQAR
ncbi:MAG: acylphosphatase [Rhodospirillales bacterium]